MERGGLARWILLGIAAFFMVTVFTNKCGDSEVEQQVLHYDDARAPEQYDPEQLCELKSPWFVAVLTTHGASIKRFELASAKYRKGGVGVDLSTTPDHQAYRQLRFDWRNEAVANRPDFKDEQWQVVYDLLDWKLSGAGGKSCTFSYSDTKVELTKTVRVTEQPYELQVRATIKNLADRPLTHALTVHTAAWRSNEEVQGQMFSVSPYITHVECVSVAGDTTRLTPEDFTPEKLREEPAFAPTELNLGDWHVAEGVPDLAAVSNAYFTHAIVASSGPADPRCQLQIELRGVPRDPRAGAFYRAQLAYPKQELGPGASTEYAVLSYVGPKERDALAAVGGGGHRLIELIDLGFFSVIAKVLVSFLLGAYGLIPNWGVAIILLTITARVLLFPLAIPSIKSMVKMRELKPEIDALNQKFKDDPQQKGLAQMELWRKHKVNPLKGCLPQLASMPVWFALYTTLQTAVELYNIPFLWFPDLSQPDPYYVLPFVIGATSFVQQKLIPMAGGDPAQQKMMLYLMPGMFTVFMLFLPAGLGVYMFTNGVVGILQQQVVEWHARRGSSAKRNDHPDNEVTVRVTDGNSERAPGKRRRKRQPDDSDSSANLTENRPALGKGDA